MTRKGTKARAASVKAGRTGAGGVSFVLDPRVEGLEPILGAAYLLMDRAYALIQGDTRRSLRVTLRPKAAGGRPALAALRRAFEDELAAQRLRWAVARRNRPVREYVAENALALAREFAERAAAPETAPGAPPEDRLTAEQQAEIERLIAEVETEIAELNASGRPGRAETGLSWEAARDEREKDGEAL